MITIKKKQLNSSMAIEMTASKLFHVSAARVRLLSIRIGVVQIFRFVNSKRRNRRFIYYTIYKRALPLNGNWNPRPFRNSLFIRCSVGDQSPILLSLSQAIRNCGSSPKLCIDNDEIKTIITKNMTKTLRSTIHNQYMIMSWMLCSFTYKTATTDNTHTR